MKYAILTLLLLGCNSGGNNLAEDIEEMTRKTQHAFYDLGAQHGAKCAFEYALAIQRGITPIDAVQDCIAQAKKEHWERFVNKVKP